MLAYARERRCHCAVLLLLMLLRLLQRAMMCSWRWMQCIWNGISGWRLQWCRLRLSTVWAFCVLSDLNKPVPYYQWLSASLQFQAEYFDISTQQIKYIDRKFCHKLCRIWHWVLVEQQTCYVSIEILSILICMSNVTGYAIQSSRDNMMMRKSKKEVNFLTFVELDKNIFKDFLDTKRDRRLHKIIVF